MVVHFLSATYRPQDSIATPTGVFVMNMIQSVGSQWPGANRSKAARPSVQITDSARPLHTATEPPVTNLTVTETVAVSIVSNSRLLSDGLLTLLSARIKLHAVAHYYAVSPIDRHLPNPTGHTVLIDGNIGRKWVQTWTHHWRMCTPPANVLVLELTNDSEFIVDCIAAGVGGYILQGESIDEVVQAITEVQQGVTTCSPEVTGRLCARLVAAHQLISELSIGESPLTPRELEVLHYVDQNLSNREIAERLVIEVRTVKHHVHNILEKLQLNNRREAAKHAAKQGWLGAEL
jgi:DNA-binding NarL/FixJ family response regulator